MTRQKLIAAVAGAASGLLLAGAAFGQSAQAKAAVDAAKAQGVVGEQSDGFLGFVRPASDPALNAAVAEINAGRAQLYREAAQRNGVSPQVAGAAAFEEVVRARLKPGEFYRLPDGRWVQR